MKCLEKTRSNVIERTKAIRRLLICTLIHFSSVSLHLLVVSLWSTADCSFIRRCTLQHLITRDSIGIKPTYIILYKIILLWITRASFLFIYLFKVITYFQFVGEFASSLLIFSLYPMIIRVWVQDWPRSATFFIYLCSKIFSCDMYLKDM